MNTIIYYPIPIHRQPAYANLGLNEGSLPETEELCHKVLSLPIFPELSEIEQQHVISSLRKLYGMQEIITMSENEQNAA